MTRNTTDVTVEVNRAEVFAMVKTLLDNVNPLDPLTTVVHVEPPLVLYCQLENEQAWNTGVRTIVSGVYVVPPSLDLKI